MVKGEWIQIVEKLTWSANFLIDRIMETLQQLWKKVVSDELTLQYYELWVSEGIMAAIHGDFQKITEIYIPELKMSINQGASPVHVFISDYNKRYDSKMENMAGKPPTLVKTVTLPKNSEEAQNLLWLKEVLTKKKEKEATLVKLFEKL